MREYELLTCDLDRDGRIEQTENALRQGFSFGTLADCLEENWSDVYWLHQECRKRQPPVETRQTPQDYDRWCEAFAKETANPELYCILRRGTVGVAVTCLVKTECETIFECGFTGILPEYSGSGLAIALKSYLLLTIQGKDIVKIVTKVRDDNSPMLRLNSRLGFVLGRL